MIKFWAKAIKTIDFFITFLRYRKNPNLLLLDQTNFQIKNFKSSNFELLVSFKKCNIRTSQF